MSTGITTTTIARLLDLLREVQEADERGWLLPPETAAKIRSELENAKDAD